MESFLGPKFSPCQTRRQRVAARLPRAPDVTDNARHQNPAGTWMSSRSKFLRLSETLLGSGVRSKLSAKCASLADLRVQ
eukprot:6208468-Pleurochrysis_carterae.AAC.2